LNGAIFKQLYFLITKRGAAMITDELLQRINELARKKRSQGLTDEELAEQKKLYNIYLTAIRKQVTTQLDAAGINSKGHQQDCRDGCCDNHHGCKH
jgi:uncharacterized protein YnzC (UPF0291/DUF896 family)